MKFLAWEVIFLLQQTYMFKVIPLALSIQPWFADLQALYCLFSHWGHAFSKKQKYTGSQQP